MSSKAKTEIVVDGDQLKSFIERIERVAAEKQELEDDIKEIYAEAKETGLNTKVLRRIVRERKGDREAIDGEKAIYEAYLNALGGFADTPLGEAAVSRAAPRAAAAAAANGNGAGGAGEGDGQAAAGAAQKAGAATGEGSGAPRVEKPSEEEIRDLKELGRRAGLAGKERDTNPCEAGSVDAQLWDTGHGIGVQERENQIAKADEGNRASGTGGRKPRRRMFAEEPVGAVN